jgi:hypothetical protein
VSSQPGDALDFYVDDVAQGFGISGESGWLKVARTVGAGTHTVRWTYSKSFSGSAGFDRAWVDEFSFTPATPPPLADALDDATHDYWSTGAGGTWSRDTAMSHDGVDAARTAPTADNGDSVLETTVTGPGVLNFWWKVSSQQDADYLDAYSSGSSAYFSISGESGWQQVSMPLDIGPQVVTWRYYKDASGSAGSDAGWVDSITITPPPAVPLATALDGPGLTWTTGGDAPWTGWTFPSYDGIDAAASGDIADDQESWVSTTVDGPGTIYFEWRVSSEAGYDFLEFSIDGVVQDSISGFDGGGGEGGGGGYWEYRLYDVTGPGPHVLRWRYYKDGSISEGADLALLDQVLWVPTGGYLDWASQYFGTFELLDPLLTGIAADYDGDGIANGVEALLALNPLDGVPVGPLSRAVRDTTGGPPALALDFSIAETPPNDLRCRVQASTTLAAASWQTIAEKLGAGPWTGSASVTEGPPAAGLVPVRVRDIVPMAGNPRRFLRFIVDQP